MFFKVEFNNHLKKYNKSTGKFERVQYHCRRVGPWGDHKCKCDCNGHSPCVVEQGYVLRECAAPTPGYHNAVHEAHRLPEGQAAQGESCNRMIHGNAFPNVPNMQECCNLCTNHPKCGSWEYSSTKMCVLKEGAPVWQKVSSAGSFEVWSGCKAGSGCAPPS